MPQNVMFAGRLDTLASLPEVLGMETALFERLDLRTASPEELAETSEPVLACPTVFFSAIALAATVLFWL